MNPAFAQETWNKTARLLSCVDERRDDCGLGSTVACRIRSSSHAAEGTGTGAPWAKIARGWWLD